MEPKTNANNLINTYKIYDVEEIISIYKNANGSYGNEFISFNQIEKIIITNSEFHDPELKKQIIDNYIKMQNEVKAIEEIALISKSDRNTDQFNKIRKCINSVRFLSGQTDQYLQKFNIKELELIEVNDKEQKKQNKLTVKLTFQNDFDKLPFDEFISITEVLIKVFVIQFKTMKYSISINEYFTNSIYEIFLEKAKNNFRKLNLKMRNIKKCGVANIEERSDINQLLRKTRKAIIRANDAIISSI